MSVIDRFFDEHWFLSNFSPSAIEWRGREWPTVEHAYQAAKNYDPRDGKPVNNLAVEAIRNASTPKQAKKLGRKIEMVEEWEENAENYKWGDSEEEEPLKLYIMRELLYIKFKIPELRDKLLGTGYAELVEGNWWGDKIWGVCEGEGTNWLGLLLMEVRRELQLAALWPKPTCCDLIQKWPMVVADAHEMWDAEDGDPRVVGEPRVEWRFNVSHDSGRHHFLVRCGYVDRDQIRMECVDDENGDPVYVGHRVHEEPRPEFCPFCATPLPGFRLRDVEPRPVCRPTDYYCLTCNERLMGCECLPVATKWEIDG